MATTHAYATLVADDNIGYAADVATISPDALASSELSDALRKGDPAVFLATIAQVSTEDGDSGLTVAQLNIEPVRLGTDLLAGHLAAVFATSRVDDALAAWNQPLAPYDERTWFAATLLDATVLAEHSDADAMKAAGAIGAATATAAGSVTVAAIAAHAGVAVLIASPLGIVLVGPAAAVIAWRLLTHKRRNQAG